MKDTLNQLLFKQKYRLLISFVTLFLASLTLVGFSFGLGQILDEVMKGEVTGFVDKILLTSIFVIINTALTWISYQMLFKVNEKIIAEIKNRLMKQYLMLPVHQFNKKAPSYYLNTLIGDIDMIEKEYYQNIPLAYFDLVLFLVSIIALFVISWKLLLGFVVIFIVPALIPKLFEKHLQKRKEQESKANEQFLKTTKEMIDGYETIYTFNKTNLFLKRFNLIDLKQQNKKYKSNLSQAIAKGVIESTGVMTMMGCIAIGGYLVIQGELTIGSLLGAVQLLNFVINPINDLLDRLTKMKGSKSIRDKINEYLDQEVKTPAILDIEESKLTFENLTFGFNDKPLYHQFNYQFDKNKVYAIIGPSGSGKSTLSKLAMNYYHQFDGNIYIGDHPIDQISDMSIYKKIGIVSQSAFLFDDHLINNICLYEHVPDSKLKEVLDFTNLNDLLSKHQNECLGDQGKNISGGERQRIALARILIHQPDIIFFDEPTASLDPVNVKLIQDLIFKMDQTTRIVITHDIDKDYLNRFDDIIDLTKI